jgi:enoyl-CoA hydratase
MTTIYEGLALRLQASEHAAVLRLVLLGPAPGNAMGPDFWRELPQAVAAAEAQSEARVLLIGGQGEHFSYGLDLPGMGAELGAVLGTGAPGRVQVAALAERMHLGFLALARSRLIAIAAVHGWCIGAGIEMIAACDIRLSSAEARFALREVKVGIVADLGGIQRLPHLIGEGWARQLALTGDTIDATTAARIGLITEVAADRAALETAALAMAERIAANPPLVLAGIKSVMNERIEAEVLRGNRQAAACNGSLMQSEDFAEAMRAFMEKRPARFRGR